MIIAAIVVFAIAYLFAWQPTRPVMMFFLPDGLHDGTLVDEILWVLGVSLAVIAIWVPREKQIEWLDKTFRRQRK